MKASIITVNTQLELITLRWNSYFFFKTCIKGPKLLEILTVATTVRSIGFDQTPKIITKILKRIPEQFELNYLLGELITDQVTVIIYMYII